VNILVTGAMGLIGAHLCQRLVADGHEVVGLKSVRGNSLIDTLSGEKNFKVCVGDIRHDMREIIGVNRVKTIFHLAAQMPYSLRDNLVDINILGTLNVLKAAYINNVEEFIQASSMSVYSEPPQYLPVNEEHPTQPSSIYGLAKLAGEFSCRCYSEDMNITILRYAGVYGKGMDKARTISRFIQCALSNQPISIYGNGDNSSDFTYVDDIVQGTVLAWEKKTSGIYNISSGQETTIKKLANKIVKLTKSKSEIIFTGDKAVSPFVLDISKAKRELGYLPHSLEDGLRLYIAEFNK
jgi:UDP-glucose 4-epimerase